MAEESGDSNTSFTRQRRDLFVITAILLVGQLAGIEPPEKLSFFGTEIRVDRGYVLIEAAWVLWAYWLLRYYQAFQAAPQSPVKMSYGEAMNHALMRQFKKQAIRRTDELFAKHPNHEYGGGAAEPKLIQGDWEGGKYRCKWQPKIRLGAANQEHILEAETLYIKAPVVWALRARTVLVWSLKAPTFTEYLLPFIFALTAPAAVLIKKIAEG